MSAILTPDQLRELAALETTPGPWSVQLVEVDSGRDASVQIVADDGHLATMVTRSWESPAGRCTDMLNAKEDGALAAAAPDLLATALDLLQRVEAAEEAVEERDAAWEALGVGPGGTLAEAITLLARGWSNRCAALTAERDGARAEVARLQSPKSPCASCHGAGGADRPDETGAKRRVYCLDCDGTGLAPYGQALQALDEERRDRDRWRDDAKRLEVECDTLRAEVARLQSARDAQRDALRSEVAMLRQALAGRGCT